MSASSRSPFSTTPSIKDTAADWVARRNGGLSAQEERELQQWLSADPSHTAAFRKCDIAWATITRPQRTGFTAVAVRELNARRRRRAHRQLRFAGAASIVVVAALFVAFGSFRSARPGPTAPATIALKPDLQTLPDGSTAELNAGAEIAVDYSSDERRVRLIRGEALFSVEKNAVRPFVVVAGGVVVKAVGTAFSVRFDPQWVGVLVTEGRVAVTRSPEDVKAVAAPPSAPVYLDAGGRLEMSAQTPAPAASVVQPLTPDEVSSALAWRGKRVEFNGTRLPEALQWFNRHNRVQLSLTDPALESRRISGIFWIDDPEAFVRLIETGLSLHADRTGDSIALRGQ